MSTGTHLHAEIQHTGGYLSRYAHHTPTIDRGVVTSAIDSILAPYGINSTWILSVTLGTGSVRVKHIVPKPGTERDEFPAGILDRDAADEFAEITAETVIVYEDVVAQGGESK